MKDTPMTFGRVYKRKDKYIRHAQRPYPLDLELPALTVEALMAGEPFYYNGHFSRLREYEVFENGEPRTEPIEIKMGADCRLDSSNGIHWLFKLATAEQLVVSSVSLGNIFIKFSDCQIKI